MGEGISIIGAGQAAAELIRVLKQGGYAGPIRLFGREDFPPYERPPLSKAFLYQTTQPERLFLGGRDAYRQNGVELHTGETVDAVDAEANTIRLSGGETFAFDTCVLATGANARQPNIPGLELEGVHVLRTILDASKLRTTLKQNARLVVVGGGYLGLEVASSAHACGVNVVVLEGTSTLMQRSISALTSSTIEARHRAAGIRIQLETSVRSVNGETWVESVTTSQGEIIGADAVLFAIGGEPATELAKFCGLQCENGIVVDARCRTTASNIYAIGDCANQLHPAYGRHLRLEAISSAIFHARSAAADILRKPLPAPKPPSFWSEQAGILLRVVGLPKAGVPCEEIRRGDDDGFAVYRFQNEELVAVETVNRPKDFVRAHGLLGKRNVDLPLN